MSNSGTSTVPPARPEPANIPAGADLEHADRDRADPTLPGTIRFLRWLTGLLAGTMILGLIAIVALLVTRWPVPGTQSPARAAPALPAGLVPEGGVTLPAGVTAQALTLGPGWAIVVTPEGEAVAFDPATGRVLNRMRVRH
jgi:hypothetical protein